VKRESPTDPYGEGRAAGRTALVVVRPGLLATVQDLGRPGLAHLAVPRSGAADRDGLQLANRLVGNPADAAGIETTLLGADLRFGAGRWVAVTGAPAPVRVDGHPAGLNRPQWVPAGATLSIGPAERGVRSYLAVAGGIDVPPVLGSRSTDVLSGLGPAPLATGRILPVGPPRAAPPPVDVAPRPLIPDPARLRVIPGPRDHWFDGRTLRTMSTSAYRVTAESNRIGVRLAGPTLPASTTGSLPSEGMVRGSVQVPPSGQPLVFLADHPTTGGYPVIGVVHPADMGLVAQARPGCVVRFCWTGPG
jgi:biotin-dependent carboxylase-like uncharacterized protein